VVLDVGTGDGKHVLALAKADRDTLAVGLDAVADAMRKSSLRAAAKPAKGGLPNALFIWAAVEALPHELMGITDLHVLMPWGSLLRHVMTPDITTLRSLAGLCVPGAEFFVALNLHAWRPPVPEVIDLPEPNPELALATLRDLYGAAGWQIASACYLDEPAVKGLGTSWTKRLAAAREELAVLGIRGVIT
jgi:16S rRNA (adenine(1408)-N(1))-methyltransferase